MRHIVFVIFSTALYSANIYICNSPRTKPSGAACDYTSTQVQSAFDNAADGDTIVLQEAITYTDIIVRRKHTTPVTVTTWLSAWLPCSTCRITPSYDALLPVISPGPTSISMPAIQGELDGAGNAPAGWNFVGVEIRTGAGRGRDGAFQYNGAAVHTGGQIVDAIAFNGSFPTASTTSVSATITIVGYTVSNYDVGRTLRIGGYGGTGTAIGGTNFIRGDYVVQSVNAGANSWTLDRSCTTGAGSAMAGFAGWYIRDDTNQPNNWTFDRVLFRDDYDDATNQQNWLRLNGYNLTLKNSFMWPLIAMGHEGHGVSIATSSGSAPITLLNNFISASGIPIFAGGVDSDYLDGSKAWTVSRYNYLYKPFKWWPDAVDSSTGSYCSPSGTGTCAATANPYPQYFVSNGRKLSCTKNLGEWKSSTQGQMEFNVHENSWGDLFCEGQHFGFTNSVRQLENDNNGTGTVLTTTAGSTAFTLAGGSIIDNMPWDRSDAAPNTVICATAGVTYDCRTIVTYNPTTHTGTVNVAWTSSHANDNWHYARERYYVLNLSTRNSVFRNISTGVSVLMRDRFTGTPISAGGANFGRVKGWTFANNLFTNTLNMPSDIAIKLVMQETISTTDQSIGGSDVNISHVTFHSPYRSAHGFSILSNLDTYVGQAKINNFVGRSNLFPQVVDQGGYFYSFGSGLNGGYGNHFCDLEYLTTGNVQWTNNYLMGSSSGSTCSNTTVAANITTPAIPSFLPNTYKLTPGNQLSKAGHDGTDIGVKDGELPLIRNLRVTVGSNTALLDFDLTAPVVDAAGSQPCVLEVSPSENLRSYLGGYTVINDLNPAYFRQADESNRSNSLLLPVAAAGGHVSWPIGQTTTATGDDGTAHNLALAPGQNHFGRLMCYADTQMFSFQTAASSSGVKPPATIQVHPPASVNAVRIVYGANPSLGSTVTSGIDGTGNASLQIPVSSNLHTYYQIVYQDAATHEIYRSRIGILLP